MIGWHVLFLSDQVPEAQRITTARLAAARTRVIAIFPVQQANAARHERVMAAPAAFGLHALTRGHPPKVRHHAILTALRPERPGEAVAQRTVHGVRSRISGRDRLVNQLQGRAGTGA
jgi:hypothetical protein